MRHPALDSAKNAKKCSLCSCLSTTRKPFAKSVPRNRRLILSLMNLFSKNTLPQQVFTLSHVALVSGASFDLTLAPINASSTSRLEVRGFGDLQAPNSLHSTRVQITAINSNTVTVTSYPSHEEDPQDDNNIVVDLTLYIGGIAHFVRKPLLHKYWWAFWGWN